MLICRLDGAIEQSEYLVADVKNFNRQQYPMRYPCLGPVAGHERDVGEFIALPNPVSSSRSASSSRPGMARRTLTYADEPANHIDVVLSSTPTSRRTIRRTLTTMGNAETPTAFPPPDACLNEERQPRADEDDFSILRLDLNLGATRHAKTLMNHLEKASISSLLDNRLTASLDHLALLRKRIHDAQSRVLVTGDLNAGKSTLVNALLRKNEIMPTDEQPLTTRFVEVVSAKENNGQEEIHVLLADKKYDPTDASTFEVKGIQELPEMVADMETDASSAPLRIYLKEAGSDISNPSILHNGVVDISLIDAPGLNRDSIKTTANFARQEEIDVVVFVVSAANHFTLSAKEFIWQAGHEKAHLFIVVNRFDQIKDKERCRRLVLDQIRQLSPKTYEDAADLVHFVDSAKVALGFDEDEADEIDEAFSHLEHSLRSFVLVNRSKSKLGPAQNYVTRLMADVELLASANTIVATRERDVAREELARVKPVLEKMRKSKDGLDGGLEGEEDRVVELSASRSRQAMTRGLERVGRGELAAPAPGLSMPTYPGLLGVWDYAHEIRNVLLASLDYAVSLAQDDARKITTEGVTNIQTIAEKHLPEDVERSQRVFNPAAMFTARPGKLSRRTSVHSVGLGLTSQSGLCDVTVSDIIDLQHHLFLARSHIAPGASSSTELVPFAAEVSGIGAASLAVGAFSILNGKSTGVQSIIESVIRLSDFASSPAARKWAGPVVGAITLGAVAYIVYELPRSIPRNVGRHLQQTLMVTSGGEGDMALVSFPEAVSTKTSREVRKVMRIAAYDLKERYRSAVESRAKVVKENEEAERKANAALAHFAMVDEKVQEIRAAVAEIKV